jgi:hypothetical protein
MARATCLAGRPAGLGQSAGLGSQGVIMMSS